jgi:hypothetical protein
VLIGGLPALSGLYGTFRAANNLHLMSWGLAGPRTMKMAQKSSRKKGDKNILSKNDVFIFKKHPIYVN